MRDKISENKASSIMLTEFNFGLLLYIMTVVSLFTFGFWVLIIKASLGVCPRIYVEYQIDKLFNNEIFI